MGRTDNLPSKYILCTNVKIFCYFLSWVMRHGWLHTLVDKIGYCTYPEKHHSTLREMVTGKIVTLKAEMSLGEA